MNRRELMATIAATGSLAGTTFAQAAQAAQASLVAAPGDLRTAAAEAWIYGLALMEMAQTRANQFADGVEGSKDLQVGMILEGVVSNVAAFGAFVDIGVHQDGLVHISALSDTFVKDPRDVVKAGDIVKVKVLEVDVLRKRIALTRRLDDVPGEKPARDAREDRNARGPGGPRGGRAGGKPQTTAAPAGNALADAFARARGR